MKKNCWHAVEHYPELLVGQYIVPNFVSNSIAIKLADKEFIILSPGQPLLDSWLQRFSDPQVKVHLVMTNAYHFLGVSAWQQAFPEHRLYASRKAIPSLKKKGVKSPILALEDGELPLPEGYRLAFPPGHRAGDVWLVKYAEAGSLWLTCDSFLNYERVSNQPLARALQKILGAAPGLKISQVIKWFILDDRGAFRDWVLERVERDQPCDLIPAHGEVLHDKRLPERLREVILDRFF